MGSLIKDLKFGFRALLKKPGSAFIAVLAFGLGIGLSTTMFSIVYGVYIRGIGVPEADQLVVINRNNPVEGIDRMGVDQHDLYDWREQQQSFEGIATFATGTVNMTGPEGPERFDGGFLSANAFDLLRVRPVVGTGFRVGDDRAGAPLTVVIGYTVWTDRFNKDPNIAGTIIKLNGEQATILGVAPEGFLFPQEQNIWIPRRDIRSESPTRGTGPYDTAFGRLKAGVSQDEAFLDLSVIAQRLQQAYPETSENIGVTFGSFVQSAIGDDINAVFAAMQVATLFVLLIACANVANLLLGRAALRSREAALRSALGASRWRVAFPFFAEAIVLAAAGAVLGIGIAYIGVGLFDGATQGIGKPYFMVFSVNLPTFGFVLGATVLTALASGAAPALQIARSDVNSILKDEGRGSSGMRAGKISKVLVTAQVALSCALLVGAGLMTKSITKLSTFEFPFETERIFTARVGTFVTDFPNAEDRTRFFNDLKLRLAAIPNVQAAALTDALPVAGTGRAAFAIEGETYETDQEYPRAYSSATSPDLFGVFNVQVVRGRDFNEQDNANALPVALVNQDFAERFFPGEDPLGRRVRVGTSESEEPWRTIVGVVPNLQMEGFDPEASSPAGFYLPLQQVDRRFMSIALRTAGGNPMSITPEVRSAVRAVDADTPIYWVRDMAEVIHQGTWFYSVFGTLFIIFGLAALFLASVGLYGVLTFSVSRRIQEMGIRMALGANGGDVVRLVTGEGAWQLGIGLVIGLGLALGVGNVVGIIMYDVQPRDPVVFSIIALTIAAVGTLASFIPAKRATRVDPMIALRND